jgi:probable HAF family extracellular repeat protein
MHDLGTLGGPDSMAWFINDLGQVAGNSYTNSTVTNFWFNGDTGNPTMAPFLWEHGHMINLGSLGGHMGQVVALNNLGQVAGFSTLSDDSAVHPFLWSRGTMTDLGTLGGPSAFPLWMNLVGDVVGFSLTTADFGGHGFLSHKGKMTDLGVLGDDPCSVPLGINLQNQIVGASTDCFDGETAVLWEKGQPPVDLNTLVTEGSSLFLHEADSINERGEIVGIGLATEGNVHVFELFPKDSYSSGEDLHRVIRRLKTAPKVDGAVSVPPRQWDPWDLIRGVHSKVAHRGQPVRKCDLLCTIMNQVTPLLLIKGNQGELIPKGSKTYSKNA